MIQAPLPDSPSYTLFYPFITITPPILHLLTNRYHNALHPLRFAPPNSGSTEEASLA
jgi:hypothetical protein